MRIRRLAANEVDRLIALRDLYVVAFDEEDLGDAVLAGPDDLHAMLTDARTIFLVAEDDLGEVVGGLTAHVLPNLIQGKPEVYLYDLAVHHAFRRRGIATQLISTLREICDECGASVLYVQAHPEDEEAQSLYRKLSSAPEVRATHFEL